MSGAKRRTAAVETPASAGVQGPGEMTRWVGPAAAISSRVTLSFRATVTLASSAPSICTRL